MSALAASSRRSTSDTRVTTAGRAAICLRFAPVALRLAPSRRNGTILPFPVLRRWLHTLRRAGSSRAGAVTTISTSPSCSTDSSKARAPPRERDDVTSVTRHDALRGARGGRRARDAAEAQHFQSAMDRTRPRRRERRRRARVDRPNRNRPGPVRTSGVGRVSQAPTDHPPTAPTHPRVYPQRSSAAQQRRSHRGNTCCAVRRDPSRPKR